jgi:RecB family endonuclease NucS
MVKHIGKLEPVPLREIWPNEASDFTAWLSENLDVLGEALGISLTLVQREAAVGPFSIDILAEDQNGNQVIVENQIRRTDHDHLGKLITYLSNLDAKAAIWISKDQTAQDIVFKRRSGK